MEKKEEIINVARELFKEYGYRKISMNEIAKKAQVTKKTIYHHFKDKDELFQYFITEELDMMKEKFEKVSNRQSSVSKRITEGLKVILEFRKKSPLVASIIKEQELTGISSDFLTQYDDEIIKYLEKKIKIEIDKKTIKNCNPNLTAFIIYKIFFSVFFEYKKDLKEDDVISEVSSILQDGLIIEGGHNE